VRFRLLGPIAVDDIAEDGAVPGGARLRVLLAALLLRANMPVSRGALAEAVWDGTPPAGADVSLRGHVLRLRRALGPVAGARIEVHDPGYLIRLASAELDVLEFEACCREAGAALRAADWDEASAAGARAVALWRGEPLLDVPSQLLRNEFVPRLEQLLIQVREDCIEADLQLGRHDRLVPHLRELTEAYPLRERFHAQLMLALARVGRQSEALTAYQHARRALVEELGIEPGPELRRLHERVLAGDAELLVPTPPRPESASRPASPREVPRQLPAGMRHFVGRVGELKVLSGLLSRDAAAGGAVVISAIGGTAGIGKTALAVHWARQHADRFPDGQLYVNLRGFDPSGAPMPPGDALRGFLTALGVAPGRIPADLEERAALYRSELAERRMLIVLDNARDVAQVRPLLPGATGCLVVATSRDQLAELVALQDAVPLTLGLLTEHEARDLLTRRLGGERLAAEEQAVDELIRMCARLPLALNIAAAHGTLHQTRPLGQFVDELRDTRRRLDALTIGDSAADVRAVFSWSYRTLTPGAARVFRLLGVHPGPDISLEAAAGLADLDVDPTRRALDELTAAHLLTEHAPGRYTFHDLLRAYATEQAHTDVGDADADADAEPGDALRRVCDFYLHTAHLGDRLLDANRPPITLEPPATGARPLPLPDDQAAMAWFDREHLNVVAAQQAAAAHQWHSTVWKLAWALHTFYLRRGHIHDAFAVWQAALEAAAHLPDPATRALIHRRVGFAHADLGRNKEAVEHLTEALVVSERNHDTADQAHTHRQLAWVSERQGDYKQAVHHATRALELYRALDHPIWEAHALNGVGWHAALLGDYETARTYCQASLELHRKHNIVEGEAAAQDSLGYIDHHTGRHQAAIDHFQQALALFCVSDNTYEVANTLDKLGRTHAALGRHEQARAVWRQAFELCRQQGRAQDAERIQEQIDTLNRPGDG
jgi:DNA-binding SARP family transcriptional activator/tetratricopeptide (TPR) repeat protein